MADTVTIIPAAGMPAVIYDGNKFPLPDGNADGFKPVASDAVDIRQLFRSQFQFIADRFNIIQTWDFTVCHSFTTVQACRDFYAARPVTRPRSGELMILNKGGGGNFTRYYKNAIVRSPVIAKDCGQSVLIRYSIIMASPYSLTP